jgi:hypothetical protein
MSFASSRRPDFGSIRTDADEEGPSRVTQLLRQGDAKVFKKYSQMRLQMKREALQKLHRTANESGAVLGHAG